jgi:hypothetical protein
MVMTNLFKKFTNTPSTLSGEAEKTQELRFGYAPARN